MKALVGDSGAEWQDGWSVAALGATLGEAPPDVGPSRVPAEKKQLQVNSFSSATAFLTSLPVPPSGCIITDVRMPEVSGIDLLKRLVELEIKIPVIVIIGDGDVPLAVEAMKLGAMDFFEKPFDGDAVVAAVRKALSGWLRDVDRAAAKVAMQERIADLSPRERDVLAGLMNGHLNKTIAYDLGISPRTVEIYRANVMTKMKAASLSELVRLVLVTGTPLNASVSPADFTIDHDLDG